MSGRTPIQDQSQMTQMCDVINTLSEGDELRLVFNQVPFDDHFCERLRRLFTLHEEEKTVYFDQENLFLLVFLLNNRNWGHIRGFTFQIRPGFCRGRFIAMFVVRSYLESVEKIIPSTQ